MSAPEWAGVRKVLCVRLDSLGDVLMCTPAMRLLRQGRARPLLTLLTSASGAVAAPYIDEIDAVIDYAAPWMKNSSAHLPAHDATLVAQLAARRFDAAVIFTSYSQSALPAALLCYLAGIPLRLAHCRENPYQLLTNWVADPEPEALVRHEVRRQLDLVGSLGTGMGRGAGTGSTRLSFQVRERDLAAVRRCLNERGIRPHHPWILMHPGASAPSRRYPPAQWAEVIRALAARGAGPIVLTGEAHEAMLIDEIRAGCGVPVQSLAGQLDLGQLGAAIKLAAVVLSNNTGPAHMAAAIGTPLADLYALTNPQHTPWQVESRLLFHDVPCRFCYKSVCPEGHHDCLAKVEPQRVVEAVCALMASRLHHAL